MNQTDDRVEGGAESQFNRVDQIAGGLRGRVVSVVFVGALAGLVALFAAVNLVPAVTLDRAGGAIPIGFLFLVLLLASVAGALAGRGLRRLERSAVTREVERSSGLADGELVGAIELDSTDEAGVSSALAHFQRERIGQILAERSDDQLLPTSGRRVHRLGRRAVAIVGIAMIIAAVSGARGSDRIGRTAIALASPWSAAFPPPPPPMVLRNTDAVVERGAMARVRVEAAGRDLVTIAWRPDGELPRRAGVLVDSMGIAATEIGPVSAPVQWWAEDRFGASRDSLRLVPVDPLAVIRLRVEVEYPAHLDRTSEVHERPIPPILAAAGSTIRFSGSANYPLKRVSITDGAEAVEFDQVDGSSFNGVLQPVADGVWEWTIESAVDVPSVRAPEALEIRIQRDSEPRVRIAFPGTDTVIQVERDVPLVVDATDDNGVRLLEVVSWRVSASGIRSEAIVDRITGPGGLQARIVARPYLKIEGRGLLPGDTVLYFARARDANPMNRSGVSDTFRVRLPSLTELREAAKYDADELSASAGGVGEAARDLERATREAARRAGSDQSPSVPEATDPTSSFESTRETRRILDQAESLEADIQSMRDEIREMRRELEASALSDPDLQRQLEELEALYQEVLESGLGDRIEELQRAMDTLDPEDLQSALQGLSSEMRDIREQIEQGLALMERVAVEQSIKSAEEQAESLARRQRSAAESETRDDAWANQQDRMAEETAELAGDLESLRDRLEAAGTRAADPAEAAETSLSEAAQSMAEAAADARSEASEAGQAERSTGEASDNARSAANSIQQAADQLSEARESLEEDWRLEAMLAVEQATTEAIELARAQHELAGAEAGSQAGGDRGADRGRQVAVRQGLENLMESLSRAGGKTALLDRRVGPAAAAAARGMDSLLARMGGADGGGEDVVGRSDQLSEALNEIAGRLLASRRQLESSQSATGMEEALEALSRMGQAQGGLNEETSGLMSLQRSGAAIAERLRDLGGQQADIADQLRKLGEMSGTEEMTGRPEELAAEADEIARDLARGLLDPETLARQEQLFRRLLDAGRSMEKDERDPERRESETGENLDPAPVPDLDPSELGGVSFPHPDEEALRSVPPAYRPLIMDYFDRLNRLSPTEQPEGDR